MKKLLFILLCLPLFFSACKKEKYSVFTTIEIRDDNNAQMGAENLLEGFELFSGKNNLENQIIILQSYSLAEETITALGLDTFLTKEYKIKLEVSPLNDESSILKLSIRCDRDAIRENIDYLNKLTEIYIRNGLDGKNLIANNTINFIDEQLTVIQDSLTSIDEKIQKFRLQNPSLTIENSMLKLTAVIEKDYGTYINKLPEAEKKYLTLIRNQKIFISQYTLLQEKRLEAQLAKAGTQSDHKVIETARLDGRISVK